MGNSNTHVVRLVHPPAGPRESSHVECVDCGQHFYSPGSRVVDDNRHINLKPGSLFLLERDDCAHTNCGSDCKRVAQLNCYGQVAQPRPCNTIPFLERWGIA